MSFKYRYFVAMAVLSAQPIVHAESVTSGSDYTIMVEVYKGQNGTCNAKEGELKNALSGIIASSQSKTGTFTNDFRILLSQTANTAMRGSGCKLIDQAVTLNPKQTINAPEGTMIVAYKDPVVAWQTKKKIVNPLPAICRVEKGKTITLKTRKSETMKNLIGLAGDGGLYCE